MALDLGLSRQWGGGMGIALSQFIQKLPESFPTREEMKQYLNTHCPDPAIAQYLAAVAKKEIQDASKAANEQDSSEKWTFPFDHSALVKTIEQAHEAPLKEWLMAGADHHIPFLFLHGRTSRVWSIADYEAQKNELQNKFVQFESWEDTGHGLPFEKRALFVERVRAFAKSIKAVKASN